MSQWTHVCGCIRVDALRIMEEENGIANIKEVLGKVVNFGDDSYETKIPCGSEGSLAYEVIENPDKHSIAAYTIPIWGDLRDYDDVDEIEKWFYDSCKNLWVRDAVLNINVEYGINKNISYTQE